MDLDDYSIKRPTERVRIQGLEKAKHLNGRIGYIATKNDGNNVDDGRVSVLVRLESTNKRPHGIRIKPENLVPIAEKQVAVRIGGFGDVEQITMSDDQLFSMYHKNDWYECPVPCMYGVPISLLKLGGPRHSDERMSVQLLIDPVSGLAPMQVLQNGLGPVVVARWDGQDITFNEFYCVHDYQATLLNYYPEWKSEKARLRALSPEAYQAHTKESLKAQEEYQIFLQKNGFK